SAYNGTHSAKSPVFGIGNNAFVPYGFEKLNVFYLIRIGIILATVCKYFTSVIILDERIVPIGFNSSFGSLEGFGNPAHGFRHMATLTGDNRTTWIGVLYKVMIKNFPMVLAGPYLSTAKTLGRNRIFPKKPVGHIYVMDVLFQDMVSAQPVEIIPIAHLVFQLGLSGLSFPYPNSPTVPVHLTRYDFTNFIILYML